jgi:hypothetical protein
MKRNLLLKQAGDLLDRKAADPELTGNSLTAKLPVPEIGGQ